MNLNIVHVMKKKKRQNMNSLFLNSETERYFTTLIKRYLLQNEIKQLKRLILSYCRVATQSIEIIRAEYF